jgi:hypothetical protein
MTKQDVTSVTSSPIPLGTTPSGNTAHQGQQEEGAITMNNNDQPTPQERADYGDEFLNVVQARAATAAWRRKPRSRGLRGALECMQAEDAIVRELYAPAGAVSAQQAAASVELGASCVSAWDRMSWAARWGYRLCREDHDWLGRHLDAFSDIKPDHDTMRRLEEITNAVPHDAAAVAALNAARWIVRRYEISMRLH